MCVYNPAQSQLVTSDFLFWLKTSFFSPLANTPSQSRADVAHTPRETEARQQTATTGSRTCR